MKDRDQILLEQAYRQVQEGFMDKVKGAVNRAAGDIFRDAEGGSRFEEKKAVASHQKDIQNIIAQLKSGRYDVPDASYSAGKWYIDFIKDYIDVPETLAPYLENPDGLLSQTLIKAYDKNTMKLKNEKPFVDPEEQDARERSAALADQQKFAAQRRQAQGGDF
jgi:hypothetical protein